MIPGEGSVGERCTHVPRRRWGAALVEACRQGMQAGAVLPNLRERVEAARPQWLKLLDSHLAQRLASWDRADLDTCAPKRLASHLLKSRSNSLLCYLTQHCRALTRLGGLAPRRPRSLNLRLPPLPTSRRRTSVSERTARSSVFWPHTWTELAQPLSRTHPAVQVTEECIQSAHRYRLACKRSFHL